MSIFEKLDAHKKLTSEIHAHFGYVEDWVCIPMDDRHGMYWLIEGSDDQGVVRYADTIEQLQDDDAGDYYEDSIYTQRHLPKWVYRADDMTMICVDTHTDGNKFLAIFDNSKQVK